MPTKLEVLFSPAEFAALPARDLSTTVCVVFDVFRATSTIVTALAHRAKEIIPVAEIPEALAIRRQHPEVLLAGEREGLRITAGLTGGIDFDLGNSPREFFDSKIEGRTIVISTTNGSRALRACSKAKVILVGSFLNLRATGEYLRKESPTKILLVCSGTFEQTAYEDVLAAGALTDLLLSFITEAGLTDSARIARQIYVPHREDLTEATQYSRNGRHLLANPDLRDDVAWCLQRDCFPIIAALKGDAISKIE